MYRYLIRRLLWIVPVVLLISIITFVMMKLTPGGPFDTTAGGRELPKEIVEVLNRRYHLDEPNWKQYLIYMGLWPNTKEGEGKPCFLGIAGPRRCAGILQGDLGPSYQYKGRGVTEILFETPKGRPWWESRFGRTAQLGVFGFLFGALTGIPLGIVSALRHNTWADYLSLFGATIFVATPGFVLAIFLMIVFGLWLHWLPIAAKNWNTIQPWLLPTFALGVGLAAFTARLTRATMLEVLRQDYIRTARAKGLRDRLVMVRHALRNAMIPVATVLGPALAGLITGSFFIEHMFSFPGMGRLYVQAIAARDYSVILGTTLLYTFMIALANLTVDLIYAWLDPRISYS
ncbi:MAG: ABC transporter permease [Chloroflexi bacterium]|nr:ABC transporter permease [Chloroflexota bacterium]